MERYTYHPLPPGERRIRLLQLLPGSGSDDIQCDIVNYTINIERPFGMYEALSYCWGDPGNPRRIQVKNQGDAAFRYLDVTANLFEGLKRLRDPDMPRMMWIDAICICQSDLEERGQQVGFMATIYAMASQVVVWLGAGSEDDHAFHDHYEAFGTMRHTSKSPMDIPSHVSGAIRKLVRSEWFTRVWVLQEVTAARSLSIMYGNEELPGSVFVRGLQELYRVLLQDDPSLGAHVPAVIELMARAPPAPSVQISRRSLDVAPLGDLIEMFHTSGATDQRDKVYALLGLRSDHHPTHTLQPDYQKSWARVFEDLIEHLLSDQVVSMTWEDKECAIITASGCTVGSVTSVKDGVMEVDYKSLNRYAKLHYTLSWNVRQYIKPVMVADIVCLLEGSKFPIVIRPCGDHFDVIVNAITPTPLLTDRIVPFMPQDSTSLIPSLSHKWFSDPKDAPRHKFLLVWDWKPLPLHNGEHHKLLSDVGRIDLVDSLPDLQACDIPWSRRLDMRRILEDARGPNVDHWEHLPWVPARINVPSKTHLHALFSMVTFPDASTFWLASYVNRVRACLELLRSALTMPTNTSEAAINKSLRYWTGEPLRELSILGVVDLLESAESEIYPSTVDTRTRRSQPMHWDFGEHQHTELLCKLFPAYQRALISLDDQRQSPSARNELFNGRYVIKSLLRKENFRSLEASQEKLQALVETLCRGTFQNLRSDDHILLLAILSEASDHQLPISIGRNFIEPTAGPRLLTKEAWILTFLFGEVWYDTASTRKILSTLSCKADKPVLSPQQPTHSFVPVFRRKQGPNIVAHLDMLDMDDDAIFREDAVLKGLFEQMYKWATTRESLLWTTAGRKDILAHIRQEFVY